VILENPVWLVLSLGALPLIYNAWVDGRKKSRIVSLSYAAIILTVAVAAASPALETATETERTQELVYLNDNSNSMAMESDNVSIGGVRIDEQVIASGNSSNIAKAMMAALEPNKTYLVSSDLQTSEDLEDVLDAYVEANATVNFLDAEMEKESSVSIQGPELTVPNARNRYTVEVETTRGEKPEPEVTVNGEEKDIQEEDGEFFFHHRFEEKGYHSVEARIDVNDEYDRNDAYYKTVKAIEKPEILVVGEKGEMGAEIEEFFEVEYRQTLPQELEEYYTVILKKAVPEENLKPYIADGNGLVFTGNTEEQDMELIPVKKADVTVGTENPKIVIGIDSSEGALQGTAGWGKCQVGESIKDSKVLATSIVNSLAEERPSSIVGAFSYNNSVYSFGSPRPLTDTDYRNKLLGTRGIASIPVCGTAYHVRALRAAQEMIGGSPGNVVLVTDGKVPPDGGIFGPSQYERTSVSISASEYKNRAIEEASRLGDDVSLHIVGVGDYDLEFIEDLAEAGGGEAYEDSEEFYQLNKTLQGGGGDDLKGINIADNDHFITRDFGTVVVSTSNFDEVAAKDSADVLMRSSTDRPFLTTWRYGLGRVAAFSGGEKDLERIVSRGPRIVSRTLSWAVGNPQRKNEEYVSVESGRMGDEVVLEASYPANGFVRVGSDEYRATVKPGKTGFHDYLNYRFAYNYRSEFKDLGYRRDLMEEFASETGGEILKSYQVPNLREDLEYETSTSVETFSLTPLILLLALIIFLAQIGYRKRSGWM
jgi:hypothetical protein